MARSLSYADAVRLLGGDHHPIVKVFDQVAGTALLAFTVTGSGLALSLFDAKAELSRLGGQLVTGLSERLNGLNRVRRGERILAANTVLAVTAYFESLSQVRLPFEISQLDLTVADQLTLAGSRGAASRRVNVLATALLQVEVPAPAPHRSFESTIDALRDFYFQLSEAVLDFVTGLAVWDGLPESGRRETGRAFRDDVPEQALDLYQEQFRRLAVDVPEFALWAAMLEHRATHAGLRQVIAGVSELEKLLHSVGGGQAADERRTALKRAYRGPLTRPIIQSGDVPEGLVIPTLGAAYIDPSYRVVEVSGSDRLSSEHWWTQQSVQHDLHHFLVGYLTAPHATTAPLLVLGQPGSGKSVLTRILAASLPETDFLVVRVSLRDVPIELDLQSQIEYAVRVATGENASWLDLVRTAGDALPVILLDGFDELLQTTGVSQSDYLDRIADLQSRESDQGRGVAVVVTSRTAVADRARPAPGMVAVRLEPFDDGNIAAWLAVWGAANAGYFRQRRLSPLSLETVHSHPQLASQPLLLLMLALYDADANALQRDVVTLSHAELYERLLTRFAAREITKDRSMPPERVTDGVDRELLRLAVVACAMFNRGRQWIDTTELDADMAILLPEPSTARNTVRAPLTTAELVLGRFFFIHEAVASRDSGKLRSYEFLHATFGEYLLARLLGREVADLATSAEIAAGRSRHIPHDDAFLHALLSFSMLTIRGTAVAFLRELFDQLPQQRRQLIRTVLLELFRPALEARHDTEFADYNPIQRSVPARHATYAANLLVLLLLATGPITGTELFGSGEPVKPWRDLTILWRSQLSGEGFTGLLTTVRLERIWVDDRRDIRISLASGSDASQEPAELDLYWTAFVTPDAGRRGGSIWTHDTSNFLWRVRHFQCDYGEDLLVASLNTLHQRLGMTITTTHGIWPDRAASSADALVSLMLARAERATPADLADAYDLCLDIALHPFAFHNDAGMRAKYQLLVFNQLSDDAERLPAEWLALTYDRIRDAAEPDSAGDLPTQWVVD